MPYADLTVIVQDIIVNMEYVTQKIVLVDSISKKFHLLGMQLEDIFMVVIYQERNVIKYPQKKRIYSVLLRPASTNAVLQH